MKQQKKINDRRWWNKFTSYFSYTYHLPPTTYRRVSRSGFTLIELLIVVLISAMLSAIVITYSGVGRDEVALSVESTAIAQTILTAQSLAVTTYTDAGSSHVCGYGVVFDDSADTYSVVSYIRPFGDSLCPPVASLMTAGISGSDLGQYTSNTWRIPLTSGVSFSASGPSGDSITFVLFYPPDPTTLVSVSSCAPGSGSCSYFFANETGSVNLRGIDSNTTQAISVDEAGQVSF